MSWTAYPSGAQVWHTGWGQKRSAQQQRDKVTDQDMEWALNRPKPDWMTEEGWEHFKLALDKNHIPVV